MPTTAPTIDRRITIGTPMPFPAPTIAPSWAPSLSPNTSPFPTVNVPYVQVVPPTYPYAQPNENGLDLIVILDRSGSMSSIRLDMEGGLDAMLQEQAKTPGCKLTLVQFDDQGIDTIHNRLPLEQVPHRPLINPRGNTPLLDAVGKTLTEQSAKIQTGKVVVLIITDGQENSSREWKREGVAALISRLIEEKGWVVSYLGANVDAFAEASALGIPSWTTSGYGANAAGVRGMAASVSKSLTSYRAGESAFTYSDADRDAMAGEQ